MGCSDGSKLGEKLGNAVGSTVGCVEGSKVGYIVGESVGSADGNAGDVVGGFLGNVTVVLLPFAGSGCGFSFAGKGLFLGFARLLFSAGTPFGSGLPLRKPSTCDSSGPRGLGLSFHNFACAMSKRSKNKVVTSSMISMCRVWCREPTRHSLSHNWRDPFFFIFPPIHSDECGRRKLSLL